MLPRGWNLSVDPDGDLAYEYARVSADSVVLVGAGGETVEYRRVGGVFVGVVGEGAERFEFGNGMNPDFELGTVGTSPGFDGEGEVG